MPRDDPTVWTVGRLLGWTTDFLRKKASDSPKLDAEVLLAHVRDCPRVRLYVEFEQVVGDRERATFRDLVRRRAEGAPVAYLVGHKEFFSLDFRVTPATLIPRADTETLVVETLDQIKHLDAPRIADIGTGSGCVALAIAAKNPRARIVAVDLSPDALAIARQNAEALGLAGRVEFREGDLLAPLRADEPFDALVSNPPYIPSDHLASLDPEVRDHEPRLALDGGPDGLRIVAQLMAEAPARLKPGGFLILEVGSDQELAVRTLVAAQPGLDLAPTVRDAANLPRVIRATRGA